MRLLVHWKDLWPQPPQVKHLKELVLTVSSVGVDDEARGLKLLVVGGGRLEAVKVFLLPDLSPLVVDGLVEVEVGGVVEAWLLEKPCVL